MNLSCWYLILYLSPTPRPLSHLFHRRHNTSGCAGRRIHGCRSAFHGLVKSSLCCASPTKENPRIWELKWNVTNDGDRTDGLPVTLKDGDVSEGYEGRVPLWDSVGTMP